MNTDELIAALGREPPRRLRFASTAAVATAGLVALALVMTLSLTLLKSRDDLSLVLAIHDHVFLLKLVFTVAVVATTLVVVRDLSVPGRRVGRAAVFAAIPFIVVIVLALYQFATLQRNEPPHPHDTWFECLWQIPALAVPAFVILAVTVRRLAPTNLVRTGAYIGLLAGGIGAVGYAFHCRDDDVAYVALSYTFAILEMVLIGALLGPRVLRWS